jgi:hypothetical protein
VEKNEVHSRLQIPKYYNSNLSVGNSRNIVNKAATMQPKKHLVSTNPGDSGFKEMDPSLRDWMDAANQINSGMNVELNGLAQK